MLMDFISLVQGEHVPVPLAIGRMFNGALVFIAMEDCGETLRATELTAQLSSQAMAAVRAVHQLGVQHCDIDLHNFLRSPGRVVLCDYTNAARAAPHGAILKAEADLARRLLCIPDVA